MGYGLSIFRVSRSDIDRAFASNDQALLDEVLEAIGEDLADYDEQMGAPDPDNDVDLSHADALREIFAGKFTPGVSGSRYGWAFELLCASFGDRLNNTGFIPCKMEWYEELDRFLQTHGIGLRFNDLVYKMPIPIPEADDWPAVGHWDYSATTHLAAIRALLPGLEDHDVRTALETTTEWLAELKEPDDILVGFHG